MGSDDVSCDPLALASGLTSTHCAHLPYMSIPSARAWCVFSGLFLQIYACSWAKQFWPRTAGSAFFSGPDSDEEDEAEDDDEAAEGEEDEMDEAFVPPPAGQGPIQSEEGKLHCGYRTIR